MFTYLHHSDPTIPHYRKEEWSFLRGATATVDRPLLGWMGRFFLHNVCACYSSVPSCVSRSCYIPRFRTIMSRITFSLEHRSVSSNLNSRVMPRPTGRWCYCSKITDRRLPRLFARSWRMITTMILVFVPIGMSLRWNSLMILINLRVLSTLSGVRSPNVCLSRKRAVSYFTRISTAKLLGSWKRKR